MYLFFKHSNVPSHFKQARLLSMVEETAITTKFWQPLVVKLNPLLGI